jgi:hypothetical protein
VIPIRDCGDCRYFTRTPDGPNIIHLTCDVRSREFPIAEVCPYYRPPPKPVIVVRETPDG